MKKLKYLIIMFLVVLISGCGNNDAKETLKEALQNMRNIENAALKIDADLGFDMEGTTLSMNVDMDMQMDKNKNVYANINVSFFGQSQQQEMYMINKDDKTYIYESDGEIWTYSFVDYIESTIDLTDEEYEEMLEKLLDAMTEVKEEKTDKEGYTKLVVSVNYKKINQLLATYNTESDTELKFDSDFELTLYLKDGYIYIVEMDMSNIINDMAKLYGEDDEFTSSLSQLDITLKISFEFYDINKINDIELPTEVEENAILEIDDEYYIEEV